MHESSVSEVGYEIDFNVYSPNKQIIQSQKGKTTADLVIQPIMEGEHSICFTHSGSPTLKIIDLDVSLTKPAPKPGNPQDSKELKQVSPTQNLEDVSARLNEDLSKLHQTLRYVKSREKKNLETVISIKNLIKYFSWSQCIGAAVLGFLQVYILKTFFSTSAKTRV